MIRSERYKLVEYLGTGEGQLFDLENDPEEVHDLWAANPTRAVRDELRQELMRWFVTSTIAASGWWKQPQS